MKDKKEAEPPYFSEFNSQKEFLEHQFESAAIKELVFKNLDSDMIKLILEHPQCPDYIVEKFSNHSRADLRIAAMLSLVWWPKYIERALKDPKAIVRFSAFRRAMFEGYRLPELRSMIQQDNWLGRYKALLLEELNAYKY
jgi:hypothetical protein